MAEQPIQRGDVFWVAYAFPHEKAAPTTDEDAIEKQQCLACQDARGGRQTPTTAWACAKASMTDIAIRVDNLITCERAHVQTFRRYRYGRAPDVRRGAHPSTGSGRRLESEILLADKALAMKKPNYRRFDSSWYYHGKCAKIATNSLR